MFKDVEALRGIAGSPYGPLLRSAATASSSLRSWTAHMHTRSCTRVFTANIGTSCVEMPSPPAKHARLAHDFVKGLQATPQLRLVAAPLHLPRDVLVESRDSWPFLGVFAVLFLSCCSHCRGVACTGRSRLFRVPANCSHTSRHPSCTFSLSAPAALPVLDTSRHLHSSSDRISKSVIAIRLRPQAVLAVLQVGAYPATTLMMRKSPPARLPSRIESMRTVTYQLRL